LEEADFESAILNLQASTADIERQSAILEAQRYALKELHTLNQAPVASTSHTAKQTSRARTKAHLDLETNELTETLEQRLDLTKTHAHATLGLLTSSAQRQLDKHDRLLDGLQNYMSKLIPLQSATTPISDFNTLARALVKLESRIIKHRINATYLDTLDSLAGETNMPDNQTNGQAEQEASTLAEELESLVTEVDAVLDMTINKQYRTPIVNALNLSDARARLEQHNWLEYVPVHLASSTTTRQQD
jgi:hypothetical protein